MLIKIGDDYRITSDAQNFILQQRHVTDPNHKWSNGEAKEKWYDIGYYHSFDTIAKKIIDMEIKSSDASTLKDLIQVIRSATYLIVEKVNE